MAGFHQKDNHGEIVDPYAISMKYLYFKTKGTLKFVEDPCDRFSMFCLVLLSIKDAFNSKELKNLNDVSPLVNSLNNLTFKARFGINSYVRPVDDSNGYDIDLFVFKKYDELSKLTNSTFSSIKSPDLEILNYYAEKINSFYQSYNFFDFTSSLRDYFVSKGIYARSRDLTIGKDFNDFRTDSSRTNSRGERYPFFLSLDDISNLKEIVVDEVGINYFSDVFDDEKEQDLRIKF